MLTIALILLSMVACLAATYLLQQAREWHRIARRSHDEMWGRFERELSRAAAGIDIRYAWCALSCSWLALIALLVDRRWL